MQRSIPYQDVINRIVLIGLFTTYICLSSIYLLVPPLLGILFVAYHRALSTHNLFDVIFISIMLLIFEAEKGFWFGSSIIFFTLISYYVLPKLEQLIQCRMCMNTILIAFAYIGYWVFVSLISGILLLASPALDWHVIMYMIVEFLILMAL